MKAPSRVWALTASVLLTGTLAACGSDANTNSEQPAADAAIRIRTRVGTRLRGQLAGSRDEHGDDRLVRPGHDPRRRGRG